MMVRVKVVAYTPAEPETGPHVPGEYIELREATADIWVSRGWAIKLPAEKPKEEEKAAPVSERAVIETPEDGLREQETATLKRRKK